MRFHHMIISAMAAVSVSISLPSIDAFTQGYYLLPSYLCGPAAPMADGNVVGTDPLKKPKAVGGVLAGLKEYTYANSKNVDMANDFFYDPVTDPMIFLGAMHNANAAGASKQFHGADRVPKVPDNGNQEGLNVVATGLTDYNNKTIPIAAQKNILDVIGITAIPAGQDGFMLPPPDNTTFLTITPNQKIMLSLRAKNNDQAVALSAAALTQNKFDPKNNGLALDGAIVYAQDIQNRRVGIFVNGGVGGNALPWEVCGGPDGQDLRGGLVHTTLLSDTNVYNGPEFFLPYFYSWPKPFGLGNTGVTTITMMGAAVTDNGFGYHQTQWKVQPLPDLPINILNLHQGDVINCLTMSVFQTSAACFASCLDCIQKGGSKAGVQQKHGKIVGAVSAVNTATLTCTPDKAAGDPFKGQLSVWTATCNVNKQPVQVVPAGTFWVQPAKPQDATGNDMILSADQQSFLDQTSQQLMLQNGTNTPSNQNTMPTYNNNNNNNVNEATSINMNWMTTMIVALGTFFAVRQ